LNVWLVKLILTIYATFVNRFKGKCARNVPILMYFYNILIFLFWFTAH
jgi:hypothetical protein